MKIDITLRCRYCNKEMYWENLFVDDNFIGWDGDPGHKPSMVKIKRRLRSINLDICDDCVKDLEL